MTFYRRGQKGKSQFPSDVQYTAGVGGYCFSSDLRHRISCRFALGFRAAFERRLLISIFYIDTFGAEIGGRFDGILYLHNPVHANQ